MTKQLSIRREVVEYGSVPVGAWLQQADGIAAIRNLLVQLSDRTSSSNGCTSPNEHAGLCKDWMAIKDQPVLRAGVASVAALAECLDVPMQHAEVRGTTGSSAAAGLTTYLTTCLCCRCL